MASPLPSCPCYSEALERKRQTSDAVHRNHHNTQQITDALEKWRPHSAQRGALCTYPHRPPPPDFRDMRGQRDHVNDGAQGRQEMGGAGGREGW